MKTSWGRFCVQIVVGDSFSRVVRCRSSGQPRRDSATFFRKKIEEEESTESLALVFGNGKTFAEGVSSSAGVPVLGSGVSLSVNALPD